jgi:hypothetical protein
LRREVEMEDIEELGKKKKKKKKREHVPHA